MISAWNVRLKPGAENSFDALRLSFAVLVIFEHSFFLLTNKVSSDPLSVLTGGQIDSGSLAVNSFFVISGFLIARSYETSSSSITFFRKRIFRIYPAFIAASLVGYVAVALAASAPPEISLRGMAVTVLKILTLHPSEPGLAFPANPAPGIVEGTFWSIKYEFDCYLIIAALGAAGWLRRGPVTLIFLSALTLLAAGVELPGWDHGVVWYFVSSPEKWPRLFSYFFAGAAFYLWRDIIPKSRLLFVFAITASALAMLTSGALIVLPIAGTYAILFAALAYAAPIRFGGCRVDVSYGLYLYGMLVQQAIISSTGTTWPLAVFALAVPMTAFISYASWRLIEAPALNIGTPRLTNC